MKKKCGFQGSGNLGGRLSRCTLLHTNARAEASQHWGWGNGPAAVKEEEDRNSDSQGNMNPQGHLPWRGFCGYCGQSELLRMEWHGMGWPREKNIPRGLHVSPRS